MQPPGSTSSQRQRGPPPRYNDPYSTYGNLGAGRCRDSWRQRTYQHANQNYGYDGYDRRSDYDSRRSDTYRPTNDFQRSRCPSRNDSYRREAPANNDLWARRPGTILDDDDDRGTSPRTYMREQQDLAARRLISRLGSMLDADINVMQDSIEGPPPSSMQTMRAELDTEMFEPQAGSAIRQHAERVPGERLLEEDELVGDGVDTTGAASKEMILQERPCRG